jgi:hypothetical protein
MINKNKYTRTTTGVLKALHNTLLYIYSKMPNNLSFSVFTIWTVATQFLKIWNVQAQIGESP